MLKMSIFLKRFKPSLIFDTYKIAAQTRQAHYFPEYQPGPYPKTKEERHAAAKKYNLLPEEYEVYAENEDPVGDYPKLPFESVDSKDGFYPWDLPHIRKDYNEAVPREIMMLLPEAISTEENKTLYRRLLKYFSLVTITSLVMFFLSLWEWKHPVCEKQYPFHGVTHYTFNRISDEELERLRAAAKLKECLETCKAFEK